MSAWTLLLLAQAAASAPVAPPIAAAPVADPVLAQQRGGFRLPNGIDVSLAVLTQTAVNGAVVLRTVFQADQGAPSLTIYAPKAGETVAASAAAEGKQAAATAATPTISYTHDAGLQVSWSAPTPAVAVTTGGVAQGGTPAGLTEVSPGAVTDAGTISETTTNGVRAVSLASPDLTITHLAGNAFGTAIANSGSDRAIDTQTTLSINLGNAGPDVLGSAMFRVQDIALDALGTRSN